MKIGAVGHVQPVSLCDCKVDLYSIKPTDDSLSSCSTSIFLKRDLPQRLIFWDRVGIVLDDSPDWNGTSVEHKCRGVLYWMPRLDIGKWNCKPSWPLRD